MVIIIIITTAAIIIIINITIIISHDQNSYAYWNSNVYDNDHDDDERQLNK